MPTALLYDERCLAHDNGSMVLDVQAREWLEVEHAESPRRISRSWQVLERAGVAPALHRLDVRAASDAELGLVHTDGHIDRIRSACSNGVEAGWVGPEARAGPGSWVPALLAAGAGVAAVDWVLGDAGRRAFAVMRPPGHHATADQAMGFCIFNNAAIAARYAQRRHDLQRVAIVDWDVHHGNGTQEIFYEDPTVLFCSIHQAGLYPAGSGTVEERGEGDGEGFTLNVPLPAGAGDDAYLAAFDSVVLPAIDAFAPELILLSAGQDPAASDPLGRMSVTTEGFRRMTGGLAGVADDRCGGWVVALHEGGYSPDHVPYCNLAIAEELAGFAPSLAGDPIELDVPRGLRAADRAAIDAARR